MLQEYKNEKDRIVNRYNRLLDLSNIFPRDIRVEDIINKKKQLEDEHFFVSFTGQIKAGKSTLINALLFGDEVIPADDTPHTAKITIIKYGDKPKIEATFYNKKEWKSLQANSNFYNEYLKADVEKAIKDGIFIDEIIFANAKVQKDNSLDNLKEYVARDGKYTPFINFVTLYYPNDILKDITIVDTPGTNDPNKLRDRVAKEWIHKTNANIYITYANQAMDKVDTEFIDKFLLSVPKEQKLTVINKIDSVNDTDGLEEYIEELLANESLRRREIISSRDGLVLVSGLGALIDKMLIKEIPLNEDLSYYAEQLEDKGFLEPENHKLSTLEKMIEKKLIENKGKNILDTHSKFIDSIFEKKVQELKQELKTKRSSLSDLFKSKSQLEKTKNSIIKIIDFLSLEEKKIDKNLNNLVHKSMDDFYAIEINQNKISISNIKKEIEKIRNISNYKNEILWIVKQSLDSNFDNLRENLKVITDNLTNHIEEDINRLKEDLTKMDRDISINLTYQAFTIYSLKLTSGVRELAETQFKKKNINKIIKENTNILQQIFNTKGAMEKINSKIMSEIQAFFEQSSKNMQTQFEKILNQYISENILKEITGEFTKIMERKKREIESFIKNEKNKESLIKTAKVDILLLEKELKSIENIKQSF